MEILEETGCRITEIRFCGLFEEINVNPQDRENYPDYCHRMIHVFTAQYAGQAAEPTEKDFCMLESIWLPLEEVSRLENLLPRDLAALLPEILKGKAVWPGAQFVDGSM